VEACLFLAISSSTRPLFLRNISVLSTSSFVMRETFFPTRSNALSISVDRLTFQSNFNSKLEISNLNNSEFGGNDFLMLLVSNLNSCSFQGNIDLSISLSRISTVKNSNFTLNQNSINALISSNIEGSYLNFSNCTFAYNSNSRYFIAADARDTFISLENLAFRNSFGGCISLSASTWAVLKIPLS
jgi:hypothetical protein